MLRTLLEDGGPVDLDDCLVGIFILFAVTHDVDALSTRLRFWTPSPQSSQLLVTGFLELGTGLTAHLISAHASLPHLPAAVALAYVQSE